MTSRRDFLKISGVGLGAVCANAASSATMMGPTSSHDGSRLTTSPPSEIAVWSTDSNRRFAPRAPLQWHTGSKVPSGDLLQLVPANRFQEILGFGGCFSDAASYVISQLKDPLREQLLHELFHPSEMNLSVNRT